MVNGTADSIITAELSNWNGLAVKIPRTEIQDYAREDISGAGVYFLFCQDDNASNSVYIGESEDMLERLRQHLRDYQSGSENFYWNAVVAFTGHDLNKALIRYLEDKLVKDARECGRYRVLTKTTYNTHIKEAEKAVMAEFIDNMKLIIATMSYNVFSPARDEPDNTQYFFCRMASSGADAKGFISSGGFTVLKGSAVSSYVVNSLAEGRHTNYYKLRLQLEADGIISGRKFARDYEFRSPSAASTVILGHPSNGNADWKTEDGRKLKDTSNL